MRLHERMSFFGMEPLVVCQLFLWIYLVQLSSLTIVKATDLDCADLQIGQYPFTWKTISFLKNSVYTPGGVPKARGGSRWIFNVMLGSGTNLRPNVQTFLPEKCTHFTKMYRKFRPKMHPSLWNVQKIWPKIVPICMPYAGQILFKDIPLFLKSTEC